MKVPILFPLIDQHNTPRAQRRYVEERLVEMAQAKTLYFTDCLRQPEPIATYVRQVVQGHWVDATGNCKTGQPVPRELQRYTIKLRRLGAHRLKWKAGVRVMDELDARFTRGKAMASVEQYEAVWADHGDAEEVDVSLEEAVFALQCAGAWVKRCSTQKQKTYWHFEEVRPGTEEQQPAKRRAVG